MGMAFRMGLDLVAGVGVGAFLGVMADRWFATGAVGIIVLTVLGFAGGLRNVIRQANAMQDRQNRTGDD